MASIDAFTGQVHLHQLILFIFVLIATFAVGTMLYSLVIKYLKDKTVPGVYKTISKLVMYGTYGLGLYFAFKKIIDFDITASLAALGILGITIFLPMVPILQNMAAGIVLSIERPFKEEDIIEVNGMLCKVKDIMLRKTKLRALDGRIIILPNIIFMNSMPIINYSSGEFIKVTLHIDITPDSDKNKAKEIIGKICAESINILPHIPDKKINKIIKIFEVPKNFFAIPKNIKNLTPKVMTKSIAKEKKTLEIWFWIWDISMKERIVSSFYEELEDEFKEANIKFG